VTVDANRLLTFCRAVEETSDAGLVLFCRGDLTATAEVLEALKKDVESTDAAGSVDRIRGAIG
jgi:hypothetical protein